ncbi:hypothetical protein B0I35DRAFT_212036 [Stachybotrys elegans]|uniref:Uncharacterized protein n=1 Tax=Stachybotrys elegans TaxID=80388 RepID=A0A8K0SV77_9HYPO|nr:hypothetical protein B0I35DRAFT_212036 [Stachybotrys elegans]
MAGRAWGSAVVRQSKAWHRSAQMLFFPLLCLSIIYGVPGCVLCCVWAISRSHILGRCSCMHDEMSAFMHWDRYLGSSNCTRNPVWLPCFGRIRPRTFLALGSDAEARE